MLLFFGAFLLLRAFPLFAIFIRKTTMFLKHFGFAFLALFFRKNIRKNRMRITSHFAYQFRQFVKGLLLSRLYKKQIKLLSFPPCIPSQNLPKILPAGGVIPCQNLT
jgi:hypothetical protein